MAAGAQNIPHEGFMATPKEQLCLSRAIMYDKRGNYGRVGFHAAVNSENGQQSVGNAWVGAYFARLRLSDAAITYLTDAPPDDMQWLTPHDNERYGINAKYIEIDPQAEAPQAPAQAAVPSPRNAVAQDWHERDAIANAASGRAMALQVLCIWQRAQ